MSKSSKNDHFFIYPEFETGDYTGHTIAILLKNNRMYHGEALCSAQDQFNKNVGRALAYKRAWDEYSRDCKFKKLVEESYDNPYEDK